MSRVETLRWTDGKLELVDQNLLPEQVVYQPITSLQQTFDAIRDMTVRGAPAIGVAAAYGMVLAAREVESGEFVAEYRKAGEYLKTARPTAVNLMWAVDRMVALAEKEAAGLLREDLLARLEAEAVAINREDVDTTRAIGENLLGLLKDGDTVLTHCNAGALATSGYGTALSVFYLAKERGIQLKVYADETRPRLQGARLTAFELMNGGVDVTLICDNMAAVVMREGKIDAVIVGADRIAANGDTANKVGTYNVSILAKHFGIPMYIAAPLSTIDPACPDGAGIPVEERDPLEIIQIGESVIAPRGVKAYNPAFDVTPAENITAIVTEKGIARPPFEASIAAMF